MGQGNRAISMPNHKIAKSLGYTPTSESDDYRLIPFNNKREKWEYMKAKGLSEVFEQIKEAFPECSEPIIKRKKDTEKT